MNFHDHKKASYIYLGEINIRKNGVKNSLYDILEEENNFMEDDADKLRAYIVGRYDKVFFL